MDQAMAVVISAGISAVISITINLVTSHMSRRKMYAETASVERINWIKKMRTSAVELLSMCETYDTLNEEQSLSFNKARISLIIHLNPSKYGYKNDDKLYELLAYKTFDEIKANKMVIEELVSVICKDEWDKVKIETGRSKTMKKIFANGSHINKDKGAK